MDPNHQGELMHQSSCNSRNSPPGFALLPNFSSLNRTTQIEQNIAATLPGSAPSNKSSSASLVSTNSSVMAGFVISKIEDIFSSMLDSIISKEKLLVIPLKQRRKSRKQTLDVESGAIKAPPDPDICMISFPGRTTHEAWKFMAILRLLELCHEALVTGVVTTKSAIFLDSYNGRPVILRFPMVRDMYYRDPELFGKQDVVNRYIDDIASTFGVERDSLNVVAAAKGLVIGAISIIKVDGSVIDGGCENEGWLIPSAKDIDVVDISKAKWILVVEKEATFRTLVSTRHWHTSKAGKGILVTAKGYPDIQTRMFLHMLSLQRPSIPICALMDFDPDGIGILSTYKHGSIALAHQNDNLVTPKMQWLGVQSSDVYQQCIQENDQEQLRLSKRDRKIAVRMLEKEIFQADVESEWRRELHVMLMLNIKAEIQILSNSGNLEAWLDSKLQSYKPAMSVYSKNAS